MVKKKKSTFSISLKQNMPPGLNNPGGMFNYQIAKAQ